MKNKILPIKHVQQRCVILPWILLHFWFLVVYCPDVKDIVVLLNVRLHLTSEKRRLVETISIWCRYAWNNVFLASFWYCYNLGAFWLLFKRIVTLFSHYHFAASSALISVNLTIIIREIVRDTGSIKTNGQISFLTFKRGIVSMLPQSSSEVYISHSDGAPSWSPILTGAPFWRVRHFEFLQRYVPCFIFSPLRETTRSGLWDLPLVVSCRISLFICFLGGETVLDVDCGSFIRYIWPGRKIKQKLNVSSAHYLWRLGLNRVPIILRSGCKISCFVSQWI